MTVNRGQHDRELALSRHNFLWGEEREFFEKGGGSSYPMGPEPPELQRAPERTCNFFYGVVNKTGP